jgi:hypothetical protein
VELCLSRISHDLVCSDFDLRFCSSMMAANLVWWSFRILARRSLLTLADSYEGGLRKVGHLRLVRVLVIFARWSKYLLQVL